MSAPYGQPHHGPGPNGSPQHGAMPHGSVQHGSAATGPISYGPLPEHSRLMGGRLLISWLIVLIPVLYGIYMTIESIYPLFTD